MFFEEKGNLIILKVRLSPNASSCSVKGVFIDAEGQFYLKINVTAVPEKGKANQELIKFLARELKTAKSNIQIISGETDRFKKLQLENRAENIRILQDWGRAAEKELNNDSTNH